jgi:hypothetical protein
MIKKAVYFLLLIPTAILFLFFGIAFITFILSWFFSGFLLSGILGFFSNCPRKIALRPAYDPLLV